MSLISPFRKVLHLVIGVLFICTWSVHLFELAVKREYEPFKSLAYRARLEHFYSEHAPAKLGEVPSLVAKNAGQEDRLVKRLEKKYSASVEELNLASLAQSCAAAAWEALQRALPSRAARALDHAWLRWAALSAPHQLLAVSLQALLLTLGSSAVLGSSSSSRDGVGATYVLTWGALALALVRPVPALDACAPAALASGAAAWWRALAAPREQLWAVSGLAAGLALLRGKGHRRVVLVGWAAAVLYLTNPGGGIVASAGGGGGGGDGASLPSSSRSRAALAAAVKAVAGAKQSPAALLQSLPPGSLKVHDLGLASVLTWAKSAQHGWRCPCFAVGAGGEWLGTVEVDVQQGTMTTRGKPLPAWAVPAALFGAFYAATLFSF